MSNWRTYSYSPKVPIGDRNLRFAEVLELLFKFNVSESETIISKTVGDMRIFLTLILSYFKHSNEIKFKKNDILTLTNTNNL